MAEVDVDVDVDFAGINVERRRAEFALAADDLALLIHLHPDGTFTAFEKGGADAFEHRPEIRQIAKLIHPQRRDVFGWRGRGSAGVGDGAGRAGHHAFAAVHATALTHRLVVVEADGTPVPLAHAADDVVFDRSAGAHATVTHDACAVVDGDRRVGEIRPLAVRPRCVNGLGDAHLLRVQLQLAIMKLAMPRARLRVLGQQQFDDRLARLADVDAVLGFSRRLDFHPLSNLTAARRHKHAIGPAVHAGFDGAHPTHAGLRDGRAVDVQLIAVAQHGDIDADRLGGIVNRLRHVHFNEAFLIPVNHRPRDALGGGHGKIFTVDFQGDVVGCGHRFFLSAFCCPQINAD